MPDQAEYGAKVLGRASKESGATLQRADARQNRERMLDAADAVFAADGAEASLDLVIRAAGVGRTTFFRHFPDRDCLLAALLDRAIDEIEEQAGLAGDLVQIISFMAEKMSWRAGLVEYWLAADTTHPVVARAFARSVPIFEGVLRDAKAAGLCRDDLTPEDMAHFGRMLGGALRGKPANERAQIAERAVELLLNGYRARNGVQSP